MSKLTQNYRLATLMETGAVVTKEQIRDTLGVDMNSVPVYIHELKRLFKADIEAIREGRKVVAYKLTNKIKVPQFRANNAQFVKTSTSSTSPQGNEVAKDGSVPLLDQEDESLSDEHLADLKDSLGLSGYGGRVNYGYGDGGGHGDY